MDGQDEAARTPEGVAVATRPCRWPSRRRCPDAKSLMRRGRPWFGGRAIRPCSGGVAAPAPLDAWVASARGGVAGFPPVGAGTREALLARGTAEENNDRSVATPRRRRGGGLIGEDGLDRAAAGAERGLEPLTVHLQRVRALARQQPSDGGFVLGQPQALELALVAVAELAVGAHGEHHAVVGLDRVVGAGADQQAGHAEVEHEGGAAGSGQQPLPVALRPGEAPALQRLPQPPRAHPVQYARVTDVDLPDHPALRAGHEDPPESLDVRQLGHDRSPRYGRLRRLRYRVPTSGSRTTTTSLAATVTLPPATGCPDSSSVASGETATSASWSVWLIRKR